MSKCAILNVKTEGIVQQQVACLRKHKANRPESLTNDQSVVDKHEGMEGILLGEDREEGVIGIVKKSGGEEKTGDEDERRRGPLCWSSKTPAE